MIVYTSLRDLGVLRSTHGNTSSERGDEGRGDYGRPGRRERKNKRRAGQQAGQGPWSVRDEDCSKEELEVSQRQPVRVGRAPAVRHQC